MNRMFRIFVWLLLAALLAGSAALWTLPVATRPDQPPGPLQRWAIMRAADDYARLEAFYQALALTQLGRYALPLLAVTVAACLWRWRRVSEIAVAATRGFLCSTRLSARPPGLGVARTIVLRSLIFVWLLLAARHVVLAVEQRTREWAYFGLRSGEEALPNISFQNRDVIRYLRQATPPGSKILVLSDQKLFFLAYYLLPRRIYHPMHPDAEFVIPQANQARPLPAYERKDISREYLARLQPDYILEYFEGSAYVDPGRVGEDRQWIEFWRRWNDRRDAPDYLVSLRPYRGEAP